MDFQYRHWNRKTYPQKHILICEDSLTQQRRILQHFEEIFDPEGIVQFSAVCGAIAAANIMSSGLVVDLLILDHDLPQGNGTDLLVWMKNKSCTVPVITFSGIPDNNQHMMNLG